MEPDTYCGASEEHVHFNNHVLIAGKAIKLFEVDGTDDTIIWLDMKNCSGTMDETTFSLLSNVQYISLEKCEIQSCSKPFSTIKTLETLHINKSSFPLEHITFQENEGIKNIYIKDVKSYISPFFQYLSKLEYLSFEGCLFETIDKDFFVGLDSLKTLSISKCQIEAINIEAFKDLPNLEELDIRDSEIAEINPDVFKNILNLKFLSFHHNKINPDIDFGFLEKMENLENIHFDTSVYKTLDFDILTNLKNVKIGYSDGEDVEDEDILEKLKSKNINTEYVFCGTIDYDSDEMVECY